MSCHHLYIVLDMVQYRPHDSAILDQLELVIPFKPIYTVFNITISVQNQR